VLLAVFALAGCGTHAAEPTVPGLTQQVGYGAGVYRYGCARCHAYGRSSVQLTAAQLTANFATADQLYRFVRRSMPLDEPASLPDGDYWAIVAYVLDEAGLRTLPRDRELGPQDARAVKLAPAPAATLDPIGTAASPK
jgi:hypothetical protein